MQPETLAAWLPIIRDLVIVLLGAFLLTFGTLRIHDATVLGIVLGAGLTLLGAPAAFRVDAIRRKEISEKEARLDDDRWSHLP